MCKLFPNFLKSVLMCAFKDQKALERIKRMNKIGDSLEQSEDKLRFYLKEMGRKDREFTSLMNTVDCWLWYKNLDGKYIAVNNKIREELFCGMSESDIIGRTDHEIAQELRTEYGTENHTFGEVCGDSDGITLMNNRTSNFDEFGKVKGELLRIKVVKTPLEDEDGRISGTIGYGYNISKEYTTIATIARTCKDEKAKEALLAYNIRDLFTCEIKDK